MIEANQDCVLFAILKKRLFSLDDPPGPKSATVLALAPWDMIAHAHEILGLLLIYLSRELVASISIITSQTDTYRIPKSQTDCYVVHNHCRRVIIES